MTEGQGNAIRRLRINKDFTDMDNGCCVVNINDVRIALALIEQQDLEISSLEQVHEYDVQMIDDVKGKAVELYNRIEEKDKIIDLMAEWLLNDDTSFGYMGLKEINTKEKLMQYFKNKVKEV